MDYAFELSTMHNNMDTHDQLDLPCSETIGTSGNIIESQ